MTHTNLIAQTVAFAKKELTDAEPGHDWWHVERVWRMARRIGGEESADMLIVELAAILHDVGDHKVHGEDKSRELIEPFLKAQHIDAQIVETVLRIVENMSFRKSLDGVEYDSLELRVVQDADRLDALGAIGIARAFSYGGKMGRVFYDPNIDVRTYTDAGAYTASDAPTINHFYEKLLQLKDCMNTRTGRRLAQERHRYIEQYLEQFHKEWQGER